MHKKLVATLAVVIFLVSSFVGIVGPVQAHFTLGNLTGQSPYSLNNFDEPTHVLGPLGWVWPGGGENAYVGFPASASSTLSPGYQAPYPNSNPPGAPSNSWYQLEGNTYSPFGAVLTGSTGDLIFGLNATCLPDEWTQIESGTSYRCYGNTISAPTNNLPRLEMQHMTLYDSEGWDTWIILIPPEFKVPDASQVVTTLTNNYANVIVAKLSPYDRYAPGWTMVAISADAAVNANGIGGIQSTDTLNSGVSTGKCNLTPGIDNPCYYNHQFINFTNAGEWYYARINGVTAPSVAGRYFFKEYLYSSFNTGNTFGVGPTMIGLSPSEENPGVWVPPQNWPLMLVKGEIDPGILTGTLRYGGYNATLYQTPIAEAGKVWAHMTMRIDPYTGQQRPDLPTIDAQAYLNATTNGHFEVEGLAPGIYDVYASAAGYPEQPCTTGVTVLKGQSLHFDCYLQPGPVIHGNVYTKHQFGDEPWPRSDDSGQYIKIELYSNATLTNQVDPSAGPPVSWTPLPCVAGGQEDYVGGPLYRGGTAAGFCGDPRTGSPIAFPWHEYSTVEGNLKNYYNGPTNPFTGHQNGYDRDVAESGVCAAGNLACTYLTSDPQGVGPPQQWYVAGGTTTPFHFEMGVKGEYGAPTDLSGDVPQVYATWVDGLTPGRYYVRAWMFRYVQTGIDGSTFQEYYFDVTPKEWAGDITLPIDLRLSSWVNKTVYFHDTPNTLKTNPIHSGAGYIWGQLLSQDGHVYAANVTGLGLLENDTILDCSSTISTASSLGILGCQGLPYTEPILRSNTGTFHYGDSPGTPTYVPPTSPLHPYYYYSNGCFSYDQLSYGIHASNKNLFQTGEFGAPSQQCPISSGGVYSALDKAGLNVNSIATGIATIQFWGINDTWGGDNYGIPSGTYTPNVYVDGYAPLNSTEQVSVTLSGTSTTVSDHMYLAPGFNVSIYSIDWQQPSVIRNWVWSGCQDEEGSSANGYACLGSEIDVGWYQVSPPHGTGNGAAGTLSDYFGAEPSFQPPSVSMFNNFGGLYQGPGGVDCTTAFLDAVSCSQMDGGGRNVLPEYGNAHDAYYGQSAKYAFVGGYTTGYLGFTTAKTLLQDRMWTTPILTQPLHFNQGEYSMAAYTYGYIQDSPYTADALNGQVADMRINLIEAVNVTLEILFKKESIITPTAYNMSARVRLFNDQGQLVATWMSSEGVYVDRNGHAIAADGRLPTAADLSALGINLHQPSYPADSLSFSPPVTTGGLVGDGVYPLYPFISQGGSPYTATTSLLNSYNFLPGGTTLLHLLMAGLPQQVPEGGNIAGYYFGDPVFTPNSCDFELDCYGNTYLNYPWPYTGIAGSPDYTGGWTAEVDFVPWYMNNTAPTKWVTLPEKTSGTGTGTGSADTSGFTSYGAVYYPPVNGLLMGESYHTITGTTAPSGVSFTEDGALSSTFLGHSLIANHLGPYTERGVWLITGTHNSGEASATFEVDLNGFISGNVLGFTWAKEFRTQSWDAITVTATGGGALPSMYTFDGIYQGFLAPGNYSFAINATGYTPQTWATNISPGQTATGQNIYLQQSSTPVPEFSSMPIVMLATLAASVYILKRRRR